MSSIFNISDNEVFIARISKLQPETTPLWGKMNVTQMMKHCGAPMDIAFETLTIKVPFIFRLLGRLMKKSILNGPEFKKNSPTAKDLIFDGSYDFETAKSELIEKCKKFQQGPKVITLQIHPFWGKLTTEEWDKLQILHLNHHLSQFGV